MAFELAKSYQHAHLVVQPSDLALNPPESYLYIQDGLIISCGVLYALCYIFYMIRTYRDKTCAGFIEFTCGTMAYELFYAYATTTTTFERVSFSMWFLLDFTFAVVTILSTRARGDRSPVVKRMIVGTLASLAFFWKIAQVYPDEREQITAYWTGLALQFPIGWGSLYLLLKNWDAKGHSLEIWLTRYLGCWTAYGVFAWRHLNVPQNWSYVGSWTSIAVIVLTMVPETIYPFVYIWVHKTKKAKPVGRKVIHDDQKVATHG
ncbi:hypothetical protein E4T47_09202 [Aureobasidium subglaciale]|nr:hypothetical protein E4T47_09202 [Aureobasidium subglaciale]